MNSVFQKSVKTVILWENPTPIPTNQQTLFILQTSLNKSKKSSSYNSIPNKKKLVSKFTANNLNLVQQCVCFCLTFLKVGKISFIFWFFFSKHPYNYLSSLPSHTSIGNSLGIKIKNWFSKMLNSMSNYRHKFSTLILRNKIWFFSIMDSTLQIFITQQLLIPVLHF